MVAGRRGEANEHMWADRVRQYLIAQKGTPPEQRLLVVLPSGVRTLQMSPRQSRNKTFITCST